METNQFAEFVSAVVRQLPREIDPATAQKFIEDQGSLAQVLRRAFLSVLVYVTEVVVNTAKNFVTSDNFKVGNAGIAYLGENFKTNFLGKVEKDVKGTTLVVSRLEKASLDKEIRDELGSDREETTLAHLFELLKKQLPCTPKFTSSFYWYNLGA